MAQPVSSVMIHMPKSGRSIAHSRENDRYFAEKVHIVEKPNGMVGRQLVPISSRQIEILLAQHPFGTYSDMIFEGKYHGTACLICNWKFT